MPSYFHRFSMNPVFSSENRFVAVRAGRVTELETEIHEIGFIGTDDFDQPLAVWVCIHIYSPGFASFNARQTRSGVKGSSRIRTPVARKTALPMAGAIETIPDSPIPLAP